MTVTYRAPTEEDILSVARRMRAADVNEVFASCGASPLSAIAESILASDICFTAMFNGKPELIFGLAQHPTHDAAVVWLLGTDGVRENARAFLEESRAIVDGWASIYPVLFNAVDARNTVSLRWLRWLGFEEVHRHEHYGHQALPFIEMARITHV